MSIPLKKGIYIFQKSTTVKWLTTGRDATTKQIELSPTKAKAAKWVIEPVGTHYTIRVMNTKNFLAAGQLAAKGDCTVIITSKPTGMMHHWSITSTSAGLKIRTVQPCVEKGKKIVQFIKVSNARGPHLELASKDSGTFGTILLSGAAPPKPQTPISKPSTNRPARTPPPTKIIIKNTTVVPKVITIEPYTNPRHFIAPKVLPTQGREGSLTMSASKAIWYTRVGGGAVTIHLKNTSGPFISIASDCSRPILKSGGISGRDRFFVGRVSGHDGFILRTSTGACSDKKSRYLVTHTNGSIGVGTMGPTTKNVQQYLWRFIVGIANPTRPPPNRVPINTTPVNSQTPFPQPTYRPLPEHVPIQTLSPFPTPPDREQWLIHDYNRPTSSPIPTRVPFPYDDDEPEGTQPSYRPPPERVPIRTRTPFPYDDDEPEVTLPSYSQTPFPDADDSSQSPFPNQTTGPAQDINVNIDIDPGNPQVVFPYPVVPDLLLGGGGVNMDAGLDETPTASPEEATTEPADSDDDDEEIDCDITPDADVCQQQETEPPIFWTATNIGIALIVFIVVGIAGYYIYKSMNSKNSTNSVNSANTVPNLSTNNTNVSPVNTSTNTNLGNLGTNNGFGDGFDEFSNVGNLGPPPPTTSTKR